MKQRSLIAMVMVLVVTVSIVVLSCISPAMAQEDKVYKWKFQSHHTPGSLAIESVIKPFIERRCPEAGWKLVCIMPGSW